VIQKTELEADMCRVAEIVGEPPTVSQYNEHGQYDRDTYRRRFGSWNEAKEEILGSAKLEIAQEEILEDIRLTSRRVIGSFKIKDYNRAGKYSRRTAMRHLGTDSWNEMKRMAGIE
jgi:hypothetical protein